MTLDKLRNKLLSNPTTNNYYDEICPEFDKARDLIKAQREIKAMVSDDLINALKGVNEVQIDKYDVYKAAVFRGTNKATAYIFKEDVCRCTTSLDEGEEFHLKTFIESKELDKVLQPISKELSINDVVIALKDKSWELKECKEVIGEDSISYKYILFVNKHNIFTSDEKYGEDYQIDNLLIQDDGSFKAILTGCTWNVTINKEDLLAHGYTKEEVIDEAVKLLGLS